MRFIGILLRGVQLLPALIHGFEGILGSGSGKTKKEKVMESFMFAINSAEFIASKDIVDEGMFQEGLTETNNGITKMLNASVWHKK